MSRITFLCAILFVSYPLNSFLQANERPNFLIITVDDMNCDSVGAFGCSLPETTPSIDQFANQGLRFQYAHVQTGSCFPSRNVMWSGRYSHNTGVEGFYQVKNPNYLHMVDLFQAGGYFVAIRGKATHSTPYYPYHWDADLSELDGEKQHTKDPKSYHRSTQRGIELAKEAGKPFFLNVNISDPHKPFFAMDKQGNPTKDPFHPSHIFKPEEVPIPGFLFDHPDVRYELAQYYSTVRRADDCFAQTMKALEESGQAQNTVVMFLSDHGMPLPFAKTAVWRHSTQTPWVVRWPGVTQPGTVDSEHMISAVDMLPTLLDIAGLEHPKGFDGKSFLPTIKGKSQTGRDLVYTFHNENSGRNRSPMRSVQSKKYGYIFNPWSDGKRVFRTATTGTLTYRTMKQLAKENADIAARLDLFDHRIKEEFYDYENDPDALNNLIDVPKYANEINELRAAMREIMVESNDPLLDVFDRREDEQFVSAAIDRLQAQADARRKLPKKKPDPKLFQLESEQVQVSDGKVTVKIPHKLGKNLGEQKFHVTLKNAKGRRLDRIVHPATGSGELTLVFDLPEGYQDDAIEVSAFVGKEFQVNLLHRTTGPIKIGRD